MQYPTYNYNPYLGPQMPMQQMQMQAQPQQQVMQLRMVTCREEVVAAQIPFDGMPYFYADMGHGVVYAKRFNGSTGLSDIIEYRAPEQAPAAPPVQFATEQAVAELEKRIRALEGVKDE